ncbi:MAG TPA: hypothetical protein VLC09_06730 [Polyangiaceae bacterium]|nr:hypothetical protein [Polyangiaceae bacterium]
MDRVADNESPVAEGELLARRKLLRGLVWAAPAVVLATSVRARAAAASGGQPPGPCGGRGQPPCP